MVKRYNDYTITYGCPNIIRTDKEDVNWVEHGLNIVGHMLLELKPLNLITFGKTQQKKWIGNLSMMVKNVMREFNVPLSRHHWAQKWCCDVHNIAAN
jgi:hypothetical protein